MRMRRKSRIGKEKIDGKGREEQKERMRKREGDRWMVRGKEDGEGNEDRWERNRTEEEESIGNDRRGKEEYSIRYNI